MSEQTEPDTRPPGDVRVFLDEHRAKKAAFEAHERAEFFASGDSIPPLDLMPECSICGSDQVTYDEGFYCPDCNVLWDRYGENGEVAS